MRDLKDILKLVISKLPECESNLTHCLRRLLRKVYKTSPELMLKRWEEFDDLLNSYLLDSSEMIRSGKSEYAVLIFSIVSGNSLKDIADVLVKL